MEEWEKHVLSSSKDQALCGEKVTSFDWCFQSVEHALLSMKNEDRLVPCKKCKDSLVMSGNEAAFIQEIKYGNKT